MIKEGDMKRLLGNKMAVLAVIVLTMSLNSFAFAHCGVCGVGEEKAHAEMHEGDVIVEGKIICLDCHLKKTEKADAACKEYGHRNCFEDKDGKIWVILNNEKAQPLFGDDMRGQDVKIQGRKFEGAQAIQVNKYWRNIADQSAG